MADETYASFKAQYSAIDAKLDAGVPVEDRARVKGEIVGLFKSIESQIAEQAEGLAHPTDPDDEQRELVDQLARADDQRVHLDGIGCRASVRHGASTEIARVMVPTPGRRAGRSGAA